MSQGMTATIGSPFVCMCTLQNSLDVLPKSVELSSDLEDSSDIADVLGSNAKTYTDCKRLKEKDIWEAVSGVQRLLLCMLQIGNLQNSLNALYKSLGLCSDSEDTSRDADVLVDHYTGWNSPETISGPLQQGVMIEAGHAAGWQSSGLSGCSAQEHGPVYRP